jgi:membrane protein implicated in regulation of membrane protease activity
MMTKVGSCAESVSMKRLFNWAKKKIIDFLKWIWQECKDWRTFVLLVIVCIVIGFPVWGGYVLYFITHWEWALIVATALLAFWWLPGAPYFAVCVAVTLAIKRFFERRKEKLLELIEDIKDDDNDEIIVKDKEENEVDKDSSVAEKRCTFEDNEQSVNENAEND